MTAIEPPKSAAESDDGSEVCRLWVADGDSHVNLFYGMFGNEEPKVWGMLLADVAAHVVRAAEQSGASGDIFAEIEKGFRERLAHNPTKTGGFSDRALQ